MWGFRKNKANTKNSPLPKVEKPANKKGRADEKDDGINMRNLSSVLDGRLLTSPWLLEKTPYFLFLVMLIIFYIGNNYMAQSKVKAIDSISTELNDLHDEHISTKSDLMNFTKRSEVSERLKFRQIKEATKPPFKIYLLKKEDK